MNKLISRIFATCLVALLIILNVEIESDPINPNVSNVQLTFNSAQAHLVEDYDLKDENCWATGTHIKICRYTFALYCDVHAQDSCSNTNPGEN